MKGRKKEVLLAYIIASVVFTYPLAVNFSTHLTGCCDVWQNAWNLWWVKKTLTQSGGDLYFTYAQFHPTGVSLALHTLSLYNTILGAILQGFLTIIQTYNLLVLSSFVLAAYGAFLLVDYVVRDWRAGFVAGLVFAFSPYHFIEVAGGHLNLLSIQWIPFYALYLLKTLKEDGWANPFIASVFLWLNALAEWQYLGLLGIYTCVFYFFFGLNEKKRVCSWAFLKRTILFSAVSAVLIAPFMYPLLYAAFVENREGYSQGVWIGSSQLYSANIFSYFLPNHMHPLYGRLVPSIDLGGARVPIGYTVLAIALFAILKNRKLTAWVTNKTNSASKILARKEAVFPIIFTITSCLLITYLIFGANISKIVTMVGLSVAAIVLYYMLKDGVLDFWLMVVLVFFVLSLGPLLTLPNGEYYPLPYILFYYLPLFKTFRAPYRFSVLIFLGLSVLAGKAAKEIIHEKGSAWRRPLGLMTVLLLFDLLCAPIAMSFGGISAPYQKIASSEVEGAVLAVPIPPRMYQPSPDMTVVYGIPKQLYYQTIYEKPMIGGYISRITETPEYALAPLENTPLLFHLRHPFEEDIVDQEVSVIGRSVLDFLGVGFVVVDKNLYGPGGYPEGSYEYSINLLEDVVGSPPVEKDGIALFMVNKLVSKEKEFIVLGEGWGRKTNISSHPVREVENYSNIILVNIPKGATNYSLNFVVDSPNGTVNIETLLNGKLIRRLNVTEEEENFNLELNSMVQGVNRIEFKNKDVGRKLRFYKLGLQRNE
ncbi:MAG: hypothetical protein ABH950_00765 [Candidatus Altiarchaeota archaeon]